MKKMKKLVSVILVSAMALSLGACGSSSTGESESTSEDTKESSASGSSDLSGTVATGGSTSMESVIGNLKEQFTNDNSNVTISYAGVGSGGGIEGVSNGTYDIGLSSRDLTDEEAADGLTSDVVALDGITVIVNADNDIDNLTMEEVSKLYNGEITNWSDLGGADLDVTLIGREESSGTRDGFESITETDGSHLDQELTSTGAVITAVASSENAIGYASLSAVEGQDGIKAVTIDDVECSEDTILDGTYAIQRPFVLVTVEGEEMSEAAQAFFDFCLSDDAKELVRSAGAVPLN